MKNKFFVAFLATLLAFPALQAQRVIIGGGFGYPFRSPYGYRSPNYRPYPRRTPNQPSTYQNLPKFQPQLILSLGYGFPNVDKEYLTQFRNYYQGNISQMGPISASLDYRFSRTMSIGAMVTHGTVSAPYYGNAGAPAFTGNISNWSVMANLVNYIPAGEKVTPYLRAALGINSWKQNYEDASGTKVIYPDALPDLAYQLGLGAKFELTKHTGLFLEAGYGKYILHGGLSFVL